MLPPDNCEADGLSNVNIFDIVPIRPTPTVTAIMKVCSILIVALHSTELSDFQTVFSFEVPPVKVEIVVSCPNPFIKVNIILLF